MEDAQTDDQRTYDDSSRSGGIRTRLNKVLADAGLASRRNADKLIENGHVTVNGKKVYELGIKVDAKKDKILVDGKLIKAKADTVYAMFNKPRGVLTTMEDPLGRPTVKDFLDELPVRLFPVGRLDWDSEGLLLLTNDGDFAQLVMHPKKEVTKTYLVKISGHPRAEQLAKLRRGVTIPTGRVSAKYAARADKLKTPGSNSSRTSDKNSWVKIVITEGKNRQIRQMFEKIGFDVLKLQRVAIGKLRLGQLDRGQIIFLNDVAANRVFEADQSGEERETRRKASLVASGRTIRTRQKSTKRPSEKSILKLD